MDIGFQTGAQGLRPGRGTIVFIHGAGGSALSFRGVLSPLGRHYNTLALDLPGHGQTPPPGSDTIVGYSTWLKLALDELSAVQPIRPFILAGHSMGGAVALTYALTWPEDPAGLAILGSGARLTVHPKLLAGLESAFEKTVEQVIDWCFLRADENLKAQSRELMLAAGPRVLREDFLACDRFDAGERLGAIGQPTLVLTGQEDRMTPPKQAEFLARKMPNTELVLVPEAGHMVHLERPQAVVSALSALAGQVWSERGSPSL
ncbi:MAG: alpha/beta hydrolase [Thermodesulfobacteriota bacterium]